jgi:hypothetical protein
LVGSGGLAVGAAVGAAGTGAVVGGTGVAPPPQAERIMDANRNRLTILKVRMWTPPPESCSLEQIPMVELGSSRAWPNAGSPIPVQLTLRIVVGAIPPFLVRDG